MPASTRVLFVSTSFPSTRADWKGTFHFNVVAALSRREDLALRLWAPPGQTPSSTIIATSESDSRWLGKLMDDGGIAHILRTRPMRGAGRAAQLLYRLARAYRSSPPDVYHINWLQNALSLPRNGTPALLTALGTDMEILRLPFVAMALRRVLRHRAAMICPNATWMVEPLQELFSDVASVTYIPFGIDAKWYDVPRKPSSAPEKWLCVTRLTTNKLGPLFRWGEHLFTNGERELHLFGPMQESGIDIPTWVKFHGPVSPDDLRENWFPIARGLVSLSKHSEGRPQVMLEAMASGLPIIAFRAPAHEDLLRHNETGLLVDTPEEFAEGISALEDAETSDRVGRKAQETARRQFGTWDDCAVRYAKAYDYLKESSGYVS